MVTVSLSAAAQEDVYIKVSKFSILVEVSFDEIKLTCHDGCVWKQLNYISSFTDDPKAIDQNGMTTLSENLDKKDSSLSKFLFTIKRTQEGVSLEGKAGTVWTSLTFDCAGGKCIRSINGWGMVDSKQE